MARSPVHFNLRYVMVTCLTHGDGNGEKEGWEVGCREGGEGRGGGEGGGSVEQNAYKRGGSRDVQNTFYINFFRVNRLNISI